MIIHTSRSSAVGHREADAMVATGQITDVAALPLAPKNPLPYRQQLTRVQGLPHRTRNIARRRRARDPS